MQTPQVSIDLLALLPSLITAGIGLLIKMTFKSWGDKLDKAVTDIAEIKEEHGNRLTAVETLIQGWPPVRRKTDRPSPHSGD